MTDRPVSQEVVEGKGGLKVTVMADVDPKPVDWLWYPYIPKAKVTMIEGDPGLGKSWITLAIATAIGHGKTPGPNPTPLPDGPGRVLLLTAEDALDDTVRPRLDTMGADPSKVIASTQPVTLDDFGLQAIEITIRHYQPELTIVDPLVAYLGDGVDMYRPKETRPILAELAAIADRNQTAILTVRHLTKGGSSKAIIRGLGSIDFSAAVRSALLVGEYQTPDPDDTHTTITGRCLIQIKNNLAPQGPAIDYTLTEATGFTWGTILTDITAGHILGDSPHQRDSDKLDTAKTLILGLLDDNDGAVPSDVIYAASNKAGISESTLKRAKTELDIEAERVGFGRDGRWYWISPNGTQPTKGAHT